MLHCLFRAKCTDLHFTSFLGDYVVVVALRWAILRFVVVCCVMLSYVEKCCAVLYNVLLCWALFCYVAPCCGMLSYVVLCFAMLCYVVFWCDMLRCVVVCFARLCSVVLYMLCHFVPCCAMFCYVLGCRDGVVVRALASHQCVPGSIPGPGVICGLSLLVLYSTPRGFLRVLRFPLSSKTNIWFDLC